MKDLFANGTSSPPWFYFHDLRRARLETLQVNLGYRCNQQCFHCHVEAGPHRTEIMTQPVIAQVIEFLAVSTVKKIDLTGGAPELNPYFRLLVHTARKMGVHVVDRCNLTVLEEPGQEGLMEFLADHQVEIIASLPCYLKENVDRQRGAGVFDKSLRVLQRLNRLGYGKEGSSLVLNLMYNPNGPFLAPPQASLEQDYKRELSARYGISFNRLYILQNMPLGRFQKKLIAEGEFQSYMELLRTASQKTNLNSVMCRFMISVDWQGYVYDCDFNQVLRLSIPFQGEAKVHLSELNERSLEGNPIRISDHCLGCIAGQGSSCQGALS